MLNKNKVAGCSFIIGVCSAAVFAVETPVTPVVAKPLSPIARRDVNRHTIGYLQKENDIANTVKKANELFQAAKFFEARNLYIAAKKEFAKLNPEYFRDRMDFCDKQINMCYFELANQALAKADASVAVNDYDEAIRLCKEAAEYYPECKVVMDKKIERYTAIRNTVAIQKETSTSALLPNKEAQDYEISALLRRARAFVNAGLYDKAKRIYQDILTKNPYRSDVLQDLRAVNAYIKKSGERRRLSSRSAALTANELEWALPIQHTVEKTVEAFEKPVEKVVVEDNPLANKIKAIIIPRIEFDDIKLRTVLETLVAYSERPENNPSGAGVNIFLRQDLTPSGDAPAEQPAAQQPAAQQPAAQQPAAPDAAPEGNEEEEDEEDEEDEEEELSDEDDESTWTELEKTSLSLPPMINKSLEEVIRNICTNAKLRYRVEKHAVVIERDDMPETDMVTRIYQADKSFFEKECDITNPDDLKTFLGSRGITFPSGAKIIFDEKIGRIFATNTLKNLDKIAEVCDESVSNLEPLVQIQLRIIEISQTDLNALGFNYTLKDNSETTPAFDSLSTANQLRSDFKGPNAHADFTMGEFSLGVDIKALNDISSKDVLASPRVTTIPGERVDIKLVTQTYFVEDFDDPETEKTTAENGDINYTYVGPFPNFEGEPQELGIKFHTTPTIDGDGLITMRLQPEVSALVGWTYYEGTDEDGADMTVRTPNIAKRTFNTNVTVRDGETLVIGGVIEDNVQHRKDKVPLLGDIPLIGRLFQSRSRSSEKKNLLIFVTPRLVKPDGTFLNQDYHSTSRGIARFL